MRRSAVDLVADFHADLLEGKQNRFAHDGGPDHNLGRAMADYHVHRLEDLADHDLPQFFGRMWLDSGEDYHLGRRHVRDETDLAVPLVVDWRAEIARRYYQASVHNRIEVTKRRRFGFAGSTLTSLEDEDLRWGQGGTSDFLTAEIERPRTGPMRDIVATIQPEQDELIRRGRDSTLCVQGAPGTGKTAVGLHRAAWLVYTYPRTYAGHGMLVVGPNDGFLRYIAGVLPTLGEATVRQTTVDELIGAVDPRVLEPDRVTVLKHDARMAEICKRAVGRHLQPPRRGHDRTRREQVHAAGRSGHRCRPARAPPRADMGRRPQVRRTRARGRTHPPVREPLAARRRDPVADGATAPVRLQAGRRCVVAAAQRQAGAGAAVLRRRLPRVGVRRRADRRGVEPALPRIRADEADGGRHGPAGRGAGRAPAAGPDAVRRAHRRRRGPGPLPDAVPGGRARSANGSLTVLGDLAQGTTPWAAADWPAQMGHLGRPEAEYTGLTIGYRVPGVIIELANRALPHLGVPVAPARSLRPDGSVEVMTVDDVIAGTANRSHPK